MSKQKFLKRTVYILTEGETEQAYFARIGEILGNDTEWKYSVTVEVREITNGSKTDPVHMVKEAKKNKSSYDEIWVVFDRDKAYLNCTIIWKVVTLRLLKTLHGLEKMANKYFLIDLI